MSVNGIYLKDVGELNIGDGMVCMRTRPGLPVDIGMLCTVRYFEEYEDDDGESEVEVGLSILSPRDDWHDMGGLVNNKCGYWFTTRDISACFAKLGIKIGDSLSIKQDFNHRGKNLKGLKCKILSTGTDGILLEFEEDIEGGGGDGMGKAGHCLLVDESLLVDDKSDGAEMKQNEVPLKDGLIDAVGK